MKRVMVMTAVGSKWGSPSVSGLGEPGANDVDVRRLARSVFHGFGMHAWEDRCDDAAQEWHLLVLQHPDVLSGGRGPFGIAARCLMMRVCGQQAQRGKRCHLSLDAEQRVTNGLVAAEPALSLAIAERIAIAVKSLEANEQTLIVMRFYRDLGVRKIASELSLPVAEVQRRIKAALASLYSCVASALKTFE